jgi:steroid delta-isomerase-like uncharacterized protein
MGEVIELVERWWAAVEGGDLDAIDGIVASDCDITMSGFGKVDRQTMREQVLPVYLSAFPGFKHEVVDVIEAGNRAAVRLRVVMTHTGPFPTPQGEVPATGRTVVLDSIDVVTVADGKISAWHTYFDQMSMLGQLGLLPAPAGA